MDVEWLTKLDMEIAIFHFVLCCHEKNFLRCVDIKVDMP